MRSPRWTHQNPTCVKFISYCRKMISVPCPDYKNENTPLSNTCYQLVHLFFKTNASFFDQKLHNPYFTDILKNKTKQTAVRKRNYLTVLFYDLSSFETLQDRPSPKEFK